MKTKPDSCTLLIKREVNEAGYWPSSFFIFLLFLWTETKSRSIKGEKRTRLIFSHSDRTSLANKTVKNISLSIRININLFISRAGKESQMCLWHNTSTRFVYVLFVLTFFCRFCSFIADMSDFWKFALRTFFLTSDQSAQSRAGKMGSCWLLK